MGIEKLEIPSELTIFKKHSETFRNNARHLQIIIIKNLREKIKIKYKGDMPRWVVPDLILQEYIRFAKMTLKIE